MSISVPLLRRASELVTVALLALSRSTTGAETLRALENIPSDVHGHFGSDPRGDAVVSRKSRRGHISIEHDLNRFKRWQVAHETADALNPMTLVTATAAKADTKYAGTERVDAPTFGFRLPARCNTVKKGAACRAATSPSEVRHLIMLSGARHGTSFVSSLIADQERVMYLGELFNKKTFMAHANIVDRSEFKDVIHSLAAAYDVQAGTSHDARLPVVEKFHESRNSLLVARGALEQLAVDKGKNIIFYKVFNDYGSSNLWLNDVIRDRCAHFIILRRNFLHMEVSALVVQNTSSFLNHETTLKVHLPVGPNLGRALHQAMSKDLAYQKISLGVPGGVYDAQYEDFVAIEEEPGITMPRALGKIRSVMAAGLSRAASFSMDAYDGRYRSSAFNQTISTESELKLEPVYSKVLCRDRLSKETQGMYKRQDKRDLLEGKVTNYEELKRRWPEMCRGIATSLGFPDPVATCHEVSWRLPE